MNGALLGGGAKDGVFKMPHALALIEAPGAAIGGQHLQPQPALALSFGPRFDGAKKPFTVAMPRFAGQQIELMQQRALRAIGLNLLTMRVFGESYRALRFGDQPAAVCLGQAAL